MLHVFPCLQQTYYYNHHINVTTVFACIFNCSVGYFREILRLCAFLIHRQYTAIFFGRAFSSDFVYFCRIADFLLSHKANQSFSQLFVILKYFFCLCSISPPHDRLQPLLQATLIQSLAKNHYYSTAPSFNLLFLHHALRVSSREPIHASFSKGAFLYSGHISALMFCAFLLRNSQ